MLDKKKNFSRFHPDPVFALGRHITIEYCECASDTLVQKAGWRISCLKQQKRAVPPLSAVPFISLSPRGYPGW